MAVVFSYPWLSSSHDAQAFHLDPDLHPLNDGSLARLRLLGPNDGELIRAGFERLSPRSRYFRFFSPMPRLPDSTLRRLTAIDGFHHVALGAEVLASDGRKASPAGIARFFRLRDRTDAAEVSITVIDDFQGRGLGRLLLRELASVAVERGVYAFTANVLPDNEPMRTLIHAIDEAAVPRIEDGTLVYEIRLPRGRVRSLSGS